MALAQHVETQSFGKVGQQRWGEGVQIFAAVEKADE